MRIDYNIDSENEEQKIYTFCGDLEKELLSIGVPIEHIEEMKKKNLKDVSLLNILCDRDLSSFEIKSVPVEKIVGVRRAFPNKSVFDNIKQFNEINGFDVRKMIDCLEYANKMQYKELLNSYSILPDPVDLVHIIDTDEYYLSDEHNHTTMCAMIFNAPFIKAKVYECHFNQKRIEKYHRTMNFYKEYDIAWIEKDANCNIKIVFNRNDNLYCFNYGYINIAKCFNDIVAEIEEKLISYNGAAYTYNKLPFSFLKKFYYWYSMTSKQKEYVTMPLYSENNYFNEFLIYLNKDRNS
jgi:hypothetical protein